MKSSLLCIVIDFAGRKGGARRLRNGQLRLKEWERDPIPDIARGLMCVWDRERDTAVPCFSSLRYVCVHCHLAEERSFSGELRDLDQEAFVSIKVLHFQLIPTDCQIKPV